MDENVSINLNQDEVTTLEDIKSAITQDVMDEISQMGYKIIENNYDTGMNILITTGMDASAIALGMMLMTSVFRVIKISKDHKRLLQLLHKEEKE